MALFTHSNTHMYTGLTSILLCGC